MLPKALINEPKNCQAQNCIETMENSEPEIELNSWRLYCFGADPGSRRSALTDFRNVVVTKVRKKIMTASDHDAQLGGRNLIGSFLLELKPAQQI